MKIRRCDQQDGVTCHHTRGSIPAIDRRVKDGRLAASAGKRAESARGSSIPECAFMIGHGLLIGLLWMTAGCAATDASVSPTPPSTEFREGQIIDTANGQFISLEQLVSHLLQQDVVYLGEEHHNRFHINSA